VSKRARKRERDRERERQRERGVHAYMHACVHGYLSLDISMLVLGTGLPAASKPVHQKTCVSVGPGQYVIAAFNIGG
jgi:hypothetical protein